MMKFKKSDLLFLNELELVIELTAMSYLDSKNKTYWQLHIKTRNNTFVQEGFYHGARGEPRAFYQLNSLYDTCREIFNNCETLTIKLKPSHIDNSLKNLLI